MIWKEDEDLQLAERVLRATREGDMLEHVWNEMAVVIGCESTDCKERWEKELSKTYQTAMDIAQKFQLRNRILTPPAKEKKTKVKVNEVKIKKGRGRPKGSTNKKKKEITMDMVIAFLKDTEKHSPVLQKENEELRKENAALKEEIKALKENQGRMEEDYQLVMSIVTKAQKMLDVG